MRISQHRSLIVLILGILIVSSAAMAQSVRAWEEDIVIPTYFAGDPDPIPLFYEGRAYQGAKGPIYPYPITDKLTSVREDRKYKAVYLENEYVKICVIPELGGRIFSAVDKTNNYDFFYRQHVIKPALIGMLGAWISGGVEWNIPHHHRASSFMPVEYKLQENTDGSRTIWVGELEWRHRMRWLIGLTLHPGKSYLEATVKLLNRTPLSQTFLYFANVAVHTNENYQVIFPPSTQVATQHSKVEFSSWPIANGVYAGQNFKDVDVSWWKNHKRSISMFAHNSTEDFLAGYDHGKQVGTLHVADHGVVNGKKFFAWGVGSAWDNLLTDADGPYLELMVGAYSDNQPDYSWTQPHETKVATQYWYPYQKIGAVTNANTEAAVSLEVKGTTARVGFVTTSAYRNTVAILEARGQSVLKENIAIDPGKPYSKDVELPAGVKEHELRARLEVESRELISYAPVVRKQEPLPPPVERPKPPAEIKSVEELYLTGLRLEQFYSPAMEPDPYYEEALRRDPSDVNTNTALGILYVKRGRLQDAETRLRTATNRATKNYTNPKNGEALYYFGLALKLQGKFDEAYEPLYRSTWTYGYSTPGLFALAEIEGQRGKYAKAVELLDRALMTNAADTKSLLLKSAFLRKLGRFDDAQQAAALAAKSDPLDRWADRELRLAKSREAEKPAPLKPITSNLEDTVQVYLEMAVDYSNAGLYTDAEWVLTALTNAYAKRDQVHPMAYYYLGSIAAKRKDPRAAEYYRQARAMSPDYCFPFRVESIAVLRAAIAANPSDFHARYYLGNLLYDAQPEAAVREWEAAAKLDSSFALVHRNLAWAYSRSGDDVGKAISSLETAIEISPRARFLFELDRLYEIAGTDPAKRLALLEKHHALVLERDDALEREIRLSVFLGKYDRALELLGNRRFHSWEGGARFSVHTSYIDAHLLRGWQRLQSGDARSAAQDFQAALTFPENLSAAEYYSGEKSAQSCYWLALAQEKLGNSQDAKASLQKAVAVSMPATRRRGSGEIEFAEMMYYQVLANRKLGNTSAATELASRLKAVGSDALRMTGPIDVFAKFGERQTAGQRAAQAHYAIGLSLLAEGDAAGASNAFKEALKLNVNHLGAKSQLEISSLAGR